MIKYFDTSFPKYYCGFKKSLSVLYFLISVLEKLKNVIRTKKTFAALLVDLSKASDFPHIISFCLDQMLMYFI